MNQMLLPITPKSITGLLNYQTDAIVSKQIIKRNNGSVTLYAFDKDESLMESSTPNEIMLLVIEGTLELKINGTINHIKMNEYFHLTSNIHYLVTAKEKTKVLFILIK